MEDLWKIRGWVLAGARVEDRPGVHCARPLLTGEEVEGTWFDRRREYSARLQGKEPEPREFASPESVVLSQLPCWKHLSPEGYRSRIAELVRSIEDRAGDPNAAFQIGNFPPRLPFVEA